MISSFLRLITCGVCGKVSLVTTSISTNARAEEEAEEAAAKEAAAKEKAAMKKRLKEIYKRIPTYHPGQVLWSEFTLWCNPYNTVDAGVLRGLFDELDNDESINVTQSEFVRGLRKSKGKARKLAAKIPRLAKLLDVPLDEPLPEDDGGSGDELALPPPPGPSKAKTPPAGGAAGRLRHAGRQAAIVHRAFGSAQGGGGGSHRHRKHRRKSLSKKLVKKAFAEIDTDHSGSFDLHEFLAFCACRVDSDEEIARDIFELLDEDNSGDVSRAELVHSLRKNRKAAKLARKIPPLRSLLSAPRSAPGGKTKRKAPRGSLQRKKSLKKAFKNMDKDHDGHLDLDEFMAFCDCSPDDDKARGVVREIFGMIDGDNSGQVERSELVHALRKNRKAVKLARQVKPLRALLGAPRAAGTKRKGGSKRAATKQKKRKRRPRREQRDDGDAADAPVRPRVRRLGVDETMHGDLARQAVRLYMTAHPDFDADAYVGGGGEKEGDDGKKNSKKRKGKGSKRKGSKHKHRAHKHSHKYHTKDRRPSRGTDSVNHRRKRAKKKKGIAAAVKPVTGLHLHAMMGARQRLLRLANRTTPPTTTTDDDKPKPTTTKSKHKRRHASHKKKKEKATTEDTEDDGDAEEKKEDGKGGGAGKKKSAAKQKSAKKKKPAAKKKGSKKKGRLKKKGTMRALT